MELDSERAAQFDECLVASAADVARAKTIILRQVAGGACSLEDLRTAVLDAEGISRHPERNQKIQMPWPDDPSWRPDPTDPVIARIRLLDAAEVALAQLAHSGVIDELGEVNNAYATVPIQRGGYGFGYRMARPGPRLAQGYGPSRRGDIAQIELLDVDIFTAELEPLGLDDRTRRCLDEALTAYRRGLHLSAVNLLGAVSEGAWYAAGELLRTRSTALATALDNDRTAKVIELVAAELAGTKGISTTEVRELQTHAAYLRDLRNYGIHPRGDSSASQEHAFSEHGAGLLLLQTHRHLVRLAQSTTLATEAGSQPS